MLYIAKIWTDTRHYPTNYTLFYFSVKIKRMNESEDLLNQSTRGLCMAQAGRVPG